MKKILGFLALAVLMTFWVPTIMQAQIPNTYNQSMTIASTAGCTASTGVATSAANAPCGGQGSMFQNSLVVAHTVTWTVTATASACTVQLEQATTLTGSYTLLGVAQTCTSTGSYTVSNVSAPFVRVNVTALTTNSTGLVQINYFGSPFGAYFSPVVSALNCGVSNSCAAPAFTNLYRFVFGSCTASAATTCAQTGIAPPFSSASSYFCAASDATTAANGVFKIAYISSSAFTITDANSSSDVFNWVCWGT